MTLAINIIDGYDLGNEACHECLQKKARVMLY